jgi:hypothetical protein
MTSPSAATPAAEPQIGVEPLFVPVSVAKLIVMSTFTFGLYEFYWFYQNWRLIKSRDKSDISPFWRTFFCYFYCHTLFRQVRAQQARLEGSTSLSADMLAAGWVLASLVWLLPDPWWLLSFTSVLFMVPVQRVAVRLNLLVAPNHDRNDRFTPGNWAAVVIGGLLFAILLVGAFVLTGDSFYS